MFLKTAMLLLDLQAMGGSFMKYRHILDDGQRCQSCCNRAQMFGLGDPMSGWQGDCGACNIRWYRGQLVSVSRNTFVGNLWGAGEQATVLIFRFAGLDLTFLVSKVSLARKLNFLKASLTVRLGPDDEYFWNAAVVGVKYHPFTLLDDTELRSPSLRRDIAEQRAVRRCLSLLDVVVIFLIPKDSSNVSASAHIRRATKQDYVLETGWSTYVYEGRQWMWNCETEEWFFVDAPGSWTSYVWKKRYWWLNGKRWFWERPAELRSI